MKLLITLTFLVLLACNNKAENKTGEKDSVTTKTGDQAPVYNRSLVGIWHPVQVDIPDMDEGDKRDLLDSATIQFKSDGSILTTMKGNTREGTYMFSEQDSKLLTKIGEKEEKFDMSWDRDLLKMKNEEGTVTMKRE